jgi:diguanylate cyclase (GGDEF)-like protein
MSASVPPIDTVTAPAPATSLDPYGQLIKMLMPRAISIGIFDGGGMSLWMSDGVENPDLQEMINETVATSISAEAATQAGFVRESGSDSAYVFLIRDSADALLGMVGIVLPDTSSGARPFTTIQGLLRPALDVLARELVNQYNIDDLQRSLSARDGDLELLLSASAEGEGDDFDRLVRACVKHLGCALGALLIPDKNVSICATGEGLKPGAGAEVLARTHRHLLAWSQVQRRTLALNKVAPSGPLGTVPYKILACPVLQGAQRVVGILVLFKSASDDDFDLRHIRIAELLARRVAHVLDNTFDPITGLYTRIALENRVAAMLSASSTSAMHSVIYIDIDRLHVINDNHGMHVGDEVIARIAEVVSSNLTPRMVATRISGDRFAMFLADTGLEAAQQVAWSLCRAVQQLAPQVDDKSVEVSASFGVARVVLQSKNPLSHALAAAEVACKAAKDRGRARVEAYQDADVSIIRRHEDVMALGNVRDALANDRFRLDAQPIIDFTDADWARNKQHRFELLLRMIDENGESIAPDKFLSAAERYQLAPAIDRWVLNFVLELLSSAASKLEALGVHFAVNLSGQSLGDENFPAFLEEKLREYALPPSLISFELTETAAVTNIVRAEMLMRRLRDMGHEFALDDFGRGLSSLSYLQSLPASYLKIDGALVRDVVGNPRSQAMITAIIQLANAMKLKTTAECVESEQIARAVAQLGVHYGQGFHIGRPRPLEAVLKDLMLEASGGTSTSMIMRGISRRAG